MECRAEACRLQYGDTVTGFLSPRISPPFKLGIILTCQWSPYYLRQYLASDQCPVIVGVNFPFPRKVSLIFEIPDGQTT